jgi:hypothetical protein
MHRAFRVPAIPVLALLACAACGSSSSPSAPSTPSTPVTPTTPTIPTSFGPYTFNFAAGTSTSDQQMISDSVQATHAYFASVFGRTVQQPSTVSASTTAAGCAQGGAAAFTGPAAVTFCVANPGWTNNGPLRRQKIVMHELFHVWQFEYRWLGTAATGPDWIIEGSAELVGYRAAVSRGLFPGNVIIGCQVKEQADFAVQHPPGLPSLSALESHQAFQTTVGPSYTISMIGMDQLVSSPGLAALRTYGDAIATGTPWPTAFQSAFGTSSTAFYAQFPGYLASLPVPPAFLCGV